MNKVENEPCLIVGQGIAGTLLSYQLLKRGIDHRVVCDNNPNTASKVAAGIYNPIVFKRITKSWMIDELYPEMMNTFSELEELLGIKIIYPTPIYKLIKPEEKEWWNKRINSQGLAQYFNGFLPNKLTKINDSYEFSSINKSGYIDLNKLLMAYNNYLDKKEILITATLKYDDINTNETTITWKNISFDKIVFCEGAKAIDNPFFPKDAFYLSKGDIIEVKINDLEEEQILNKDIFILPKGENRFIVGSTYGHDNLQTIPLEKDLQYLLDKLKQITSNSIKVLNHKVGIRPTVKDRRPILGFHPNHDKIAFFNGMGTKGVLIAPFFAKQMIDLIQDNNSIPNNEVNIERFYK